MTTARFSPPDRACRRSPHPTRGALLAALVTALAAALPLAAPAAGAQTGSGTVSFAFTTFSGPFAASASADALDPAAWSLTGLVNGAQPSPSGWVPLGDPTVPDYGYVTGTYTYAAPTNETLLRYTYLAPGAPGENVIRFTPRPFSNVTLGQDFVLGTLTFQNGFWVGGGATAAFNTPTNLGFRVTTSSADGVQFNQTIEGVIRLVVNQLDDTVYDMALLANQEAEADWIYIDSPANIGSMGAFRVFDNCCHPTGVSNVGTVDVVARFNSLHLVELTNSQGGFVTRGVAPLAPVGTTATPEPETWALVGGGLGALGAWRRRRRT